MTTAITIGVDLGTTSCKAGAYSLDGTLLGSGSAPCTVDHPKPGWAEQDPAGYWAGAVSAVRQALAQVDRTAVRALACCGHTPSMVLVDRHGRPVRAAIIWQDSRATAEATALDEEVSAAQWRDWLGMDLPRNASYPPARLRWLHTHEPDVLARAYRLLQPKDYLNYCLTGRLASDYWGSKGLIHLSSGAPVAAYADVLGIAPELAPPVYHPHQELGTLTPAAADALGLPAALPVAVGWTDALAGMLGTGALADAGQAFDIAGTSEIVGVTSREEPAEPAGMLVAPVMNTALRLVYGPTQTSGAALQWLLRSFYPNEQEHMPQHVESLAGLSSERLLFLPYLEGERTPIWDSHARGVFFRISSTHAREHFARAVLEGVAFSVRHVLDVAQLVTGTAVDALRLSGGGAELRVWNTIKASVLGIPVYPTTVRDAGTLGAAMLAAMAYGAYESIDEASRAMVRLADPIMPDEALLAYYNQLYQEYRILYQRLHDLF